MDNNRPGHRPIVDTVLSSLETNLEATVGYFQEANAMRSDAG